MITALFPRCGRSDRYLRSLAILGSGLVACTPALAGRPFATEDAGVLAQGKCELELFQVSQRARGAEAERSSTAQVGCGVAESTQLALAYARNRADGEHWPALSLVGKTALRPVADRDVGVALAYSLTGERLPGRETEFSGAALSLVGTEVRGATQFHANLGVRHDRVANDSATTWAFAMELPGERLDYGLELFGEDSRSAFVGAGLRIAAIAGRLALDGSYAIQANSGRERLITIGLKAAF